MRRTLSGRDGLLALFFLVALLASPADGRAQEPPIVAAASSLQFALDDVARGFRAETGHSVRLVFGSSGNLARQIRGGAPFEVYLSADESHVLDLARDGFSRGTGDVYAYGRLAIMVPHGSPLQADPTLADLAAALDDGRLVRFAIASPDHAPYGRCAREVLVRRGLWEAIEPRLVFGESVTQAARFASSANAQGGLVAYSTALSPPMASLGTFALIAEDWHSPLRHRMVLTKGAGAVAESFYEYLRQPFARGILRRNGFTLPSGPD